MLFGIKAVEAKYSRSMTQSLFPATMQDQLQAKLQELNARAERGHIKVTDDLLERIEALIPVEPLVPKTPKLKQLHDREEFNGELSHLAELFLFHLYTHMELVGWYDVDPEECPRITELILHNVQPDLESIIQDAAKLYMTLDGKVNCHKRLVWKSCQVDTLIACTLVMLPDTGTPDVLNSLLYAGPLGSQLAHDIFGESIGDLMAPDKKDAEGNALPNQKRRAALNFIKGRIDKAFIPAGLLASEAKQPCRIQNPLRIKDKACTVYSMPVTADPCESSILPF